MAEKMNSSPCVCLAKVVELDLSTVVPCCSGPKRPQDKIPLSDMKKDFETCLGAKVRLAFYDLSCMFAHCLAQHSQIIKFKHGPPYQKVTTI